MKGQQAFILLDIHCTSRLLLPLAEKKLHQLHLSTSSQRLRSNHKTKVCSHNASQRSFTPPSQGQHDHKTIKCDLHLSALLHVLLLLHADLPGCSTRARALTPGVEVVARPAGLRWQPGHGGASLLCSVMPLVCPSLLRRVRQPRQRSPGG